MTLDDLKADWAKRDAALTRSLAATRTALRDSMIDTQRPKIRRKSDLNAFNVIVFVITVLFLGSFVGDHWNDVRFAAPGALLLAWTLAMGALHARERVLIEQIDYGAAPSQIQQRLAKLREQRARTFQWALLTGQLVWWVPFFIVIMKGLLDVDLYTISETMPRILAVNFAAGLAFIPLAWLAARTLSARLRGNSAWRSFIDGVAGRDLTEARALADRLAKFEEEAAA
jgi:hypothetical protein